MKATNNTQKLFTTGQLIGLISICAVIITLVAIWLTSNFSAFGGTY